jgi:hypothetical protein
LRRILTGDFPTDLTPQQILSEIADHPQEFSSRLQALIDRDDAFFRRGMTF